MFEVKRILLSLLLLATLHGFADPVTIPDEIKDGGRVWIDFNSKELVQTLPGATLNDAAELAGAILETYLRPNVESGCVTLRTLELINFCYQAFDLQVRKCRIGFEEEMGRTSDEGKKIAYFYDFDVAKDKDKAYSTRKLIDELPFVLDGESRSFCNLYNVKANDNARLFYKEDKIDSVMESARNSEKVEVLELDTRAYGDLPELEWCFGWRPSLGWQSGIGGVAFVAGVGVVCLCSGPVAWISGVALILGGGGMVFTSDRRIPLEAAKLSNESVEKYLEQVRERRSYLNVIEDPCGHYQRAYLGLVKITTLIDACKRYRWSCLGAVSARAQEKLDFEAKTARDQAWSDLTRLEDSCVNYPLMVDLMEATSACLYLCYLDVEKTALSDKEKNKIRETYLKNAETVADVCSRLSRYSTGHLAYAHMGEYNTRFLQCYATNRVGLAGLSEKGQIKEYREKFEPKFSDEDIDLVQKGLVSLPLGCEYVKIKECKDRLQGNTLLNEIVGRQMGGDKLESWKREASGRIEEQWLYPGWCEELSSAISPEGTKDILVICTEFSPIVQRASRVRMLFDAVVAEDSELVGLASLKEVFDSADTIDEVKRAIIKEIGRRKLGDLKEEIEGNHGRVEDMVDRWIDAAVLDGTSDKVGCSKLSVRDVAARMKNEILPMWRKIELCERKPWWKFW